MHPDLVAELIGQQVERARRHPDLVDRVGITQEGTSVLVRGAAAGEPILARLNGPNFDAEPFSLEMLDPVSRAPLEAARWPGSLAIGGHPVLGRPAACLLGLHEYYCHPSHTGESWDQSRYALDLPTLLLHILNKAGA